MFQHNAKVLVKNTAPFHAGRIGYFQFENVELKMSNFKKRNFHRVEQGENRPYGIWFESEIFGFEPPQKIWIANPEDWPDSRYEKNPIFIFGFADATFVAVLGKRHLEEAMDDVSNWILEMVPGITMEPDYPDDLDRQDSECDLTDFALGNEPPVWIPSWEWIVQKLDHQTGVWESAISAAESSSSSDDWGIRRVTSDLEAALQRRADECLVTTLSTLDDATVSELESEGYNTESAYAIASNADDSVIAVNGDLIVFGKDFNLDPINANEAMLWNEKDRNGSTSIKVLMDRFRDSNYELVDRCGHWPTGEESEISVDGAFEEMMNLGHGAAAIDRSFQIIFKQEDYGAHVYWNSSSGDVEIYALRRPRWATYSEVHL